MSVREELDNLLERALKNQTLREHLLDTRSEHDPLGAFCREAKALGCSFTPMALIAEGEESYAAMSRSTNGGGENHPLLAWENDLYELFFTVLEAK